MSPSQAIETLFVVDERELSWKIRTAGKGQLQPVRADNYQRLNGWKATVTGRSLPFFIRQFAPTFPVHRQIRCPDTEPCYRALRDPGAAVPL